jgi:hypothetical protein
MVLRHYRRVGVELRTLVQVRVDVDHPFVNLSLTCFFTGQPGAYGATADILNLLHLSSQGTHTLLLCCSAFHFPSRAFSR